MPLEADSHPVHSAPPVFLHIGTMKSGTTFLQDVLIRNKTRLAAAGYLFPGETWREQVSAARDVAPAPMKDPVYRAEARGAWQSLAQQMLHHEGTASVVSMEFLGYAGPRHARRAVRSLDPADVHVILTVRDAARIIPGQWQTAVTAMGTASWQDFRVSLRRATGVRARLAPRTDPVAASFRKIHDVSRMLQAWGRSVPPERLHVVTVPRSGADPMLLWKRFAEVVGVDPEFGLGTDHLRLNESLGYASTELFRRVNLALRGVPHHEHVATLKRHLAERILRQRNREESPPSLDRATLDFALGWNSRTREAITRKGVHLVGDLEDLPTSPTERHLASLDDDQPPPSDAELLEAAHAAIEGMAQLVERQRRQAAKRGIDVTSSPSAGDARHEGATDQESSAVAEIASLCRTSIELRRRLST